MATQVRRHSFDQTPTVFAKIFDEIPTFEEAFDTASLREFFHAYESTNSQSAYSPHKDSFMFEEGHPNHLNDSILTSTSHFFADFPVQDGAKKQQRSFSFNFGSEPKSSRSKLPSQVPIIMEAPFIINQLHRKKSSSKASDKSSDTQRELKDTEIRIKIPRSPVTTEKKSRGKAKKDPESNVENLLKKKQVFKIIRDVKPKETSLNRKRQHSDIVKDDSIPLTKQVKGRRSSRRFSIESNYSVVTNTSETNVAAYNPTVSSQFEQF